MTPIFIERILTERSPHKLHVYLKKQASDSLASVARADPLEQLNPAVHSLGYLFILYRLLSERELIVGKRGWSICRTRMWEDLLRK
jgi:hypothetical protein